ncbi:MAG TPA: putative ABC transporter permease [Pseudolysinimonas sp.]|nr:putative ABC transporter permease [Pseudolysinimonas sp.]
MSDALFTATWVFVLGSVGGVLLERVWMRLLEGPGDVDPRSGLLYIPFNPLYGFAAVVGSLVLAPLAWSPPLVFLAALVIFTVVEGIASLVMEHVFGVVFWDYSDRRLNLGGRVCLEYALLWGALGLVLVYLLDPALRSIVELLPRPMSDIVAVVILGLVTTAAVLTLTGFARLKSTIAGWTSTTATPEADWDRIIDRLAPPDAVAAAFPHMNLSVRYRRLRNRRRDRPTLRR